jgi:hypothetical protein
MKPGKYTAIMKHEFNEEKIVEFEILNNETLDTMFYFSYKSGEYSNYQGDKYIIGYNSDKSRNIYGINFSGDNVLEAPYNQNIYGLNLSFGDLGFINTPKTNGKRIYGITLSPFEIGEHYVYGISFNLIHKNLTHKYLNISLLYSDIRYHDGINITPYNSNNYSGYFNLSFVNNILMNKGVGLALTNIASTNNGLTIGLYNEHHFSKFSIGVVNHFELSKYFVLGVLNVRKYYGYDSPLDPYQHLSNVTIGLVNYLPKNNNSILELGAYNYTNFNYGLQLGVYNSLNTNQFLQMGLLNKNSNNIGLQLGIINISNQNSGLQVGVININSVRWMPVFNW